MDEQENYLTIEIINELFIIKTKDIISLDEIKEKAIKQFNLTNISKDMLKFHLKNNKDIYIKTDDDLFKYSDFSDSENLNIGICISIDDKEKFRNNYEGKINELKEKIKKLKEKNKNYSQQINDYEKKIADLLKENHVYENKIKILNNEINNLKKKILDFNDFTYVFKNKYKNLKKEKSKLEAKIRETPIQEINSNNNLKNETLEKNITPGNTPFPETNKNNNQNNETPTQNNDQNINKDNYLNEIKNKTIKRSYSLQNSETKNNYYANEVDNNSSINKIEEKTNIIEDINNKEKNINQNNNIDLNINKQINNKNGKILIPKLNISNNLSENEISKGNKKNDLNLRKNESDNFQKSNFFLEDCISIDKEHKCQTDRIDSEKAKALKEIREKFKELNEFSDEVIYAKLEENDGDDMRTACDLMLGVTRIIKK